MDLNILEICLLGALVFCFLVQLYFSLFVHLKLALIAVKDASEQKNTPISIIICARNEAENLKQFLPSILNQEYQNFEVVVVNDRSWDGTAEILEDFEKKYDRLKVVTG
ncbi:MAG: glycosyltransferase [Chitinophagaceae bacterium]|nr:MAG: glycosyltransferase [Chitinophagaceae bacterium]